MYTAFNLKIKLSDFENPVSLINVGQQRRNQLQKDSNKELERFILQNGIIDGTELSADWFQTVQSDIFISHSHNDEDLAFALAGWLKKTFDLNVFMDEVIWGSADELLRTIDKKYCWQPETRTYNYTKRNLTTSHIHAMLSTAIYSVMDNTEVVLFLNTTESLPMIGNVLSENSKHTLSPWIYQELMATRLLRVTDWQEYRRKAVLEHSLSKYASSGLRIAYKTPVDELSELNADTLQSWMDNYITREEQPYGGIFSKVPDHPLNYLYDTVFGTERKK